ncbi:MAG: PhzF family phenazine biosynthesis protein [Verrucomicrobiae bacterium]|nr:PhzF family phenazine biosynthesis protein [Verrucomicrobiae bacterium]
MRGLPYFQVDAFTDRLFAGNPAGVCVLPEWLPDALLQAIAAENGLSETAFLVAGDPALRLRWFTPTVEVDLCGHATLAAAHVLFRHLDHAGPSLSFHTRSGPLTVTRSGERLSLDFPARPGVPCPAPADLVAGLGRAPLSVAKARDYLAVFESERVIRELNPNMEALSRLDCLGVIVTTPGETCDFVSRFFAPGAGVPEDPVTGSAHCTLIPWWAERLGRSRLHARQVSRRGGELFCEHRGKRVGIAGHAVTYSAGFLQIPAFGRVAAS